MQVSDCPPLEERSPNEPTSHLPSPSPSQLPASRKRKREQNPDTQTETIKQSTPPRGIRADEIAYWATHHEWSGDRFQHEMASSSRRSRSDSDSLASTRTTHRAEYLARLEQHGIFMADTRPIVEKASREQCEELLVASRTEHTYSPFAPVFDALQETIGSRSEERIKRDMGPWVAPSPETLRMLGEPEHGLSLLREESNLEWTRCEVMGGTTPKPDFTVGLRPTAFTTEETSKLEKYSTLRRHFQVLPGLYYPFLVAEVKSGEQGINKASRQNLHSGAIAVRAIVNLYKQAFGAKSNVLDKDIYGRVLCFSIAHDWNQVSIHGHFAIFDPETQSEQYYRHLIATYILSKETERLAPYNFARNLYEKFAPDHLDRIKRGIAELSSMPPPTGASDREAESIQTPESTNVALAQELTSVRDELERQRDVSKAELSMLKESSASELSKLRDEMRLQRETNEKHIQMLLERLNQER